MADLGDAQAQQWQRRHGWERPWHPLQARLLALKRALLQSMMVSHSLRFHEPLNCARAHAFVRWWVLRSCSTTQALPDALRLLWTKI